MADDDRKPNPLEDLRKGLGLLIRAAKTTIEQLPTGKLEEAVVSGAKEVGRALENVAAQVEKQMHRKPGGPGAPGGPTAHDGGGAAPSGDAGADSSTEAKTDEPAAGGGEPPKPSA